MPELPEVETIRTQLEKFLVGRKVIGIEIKTPKIFQGDKKKILDTKILAIRRFGKVIVIDLNNDYSLLVHLKLTGQLLYKCPHLNTQGPNLPGKHTHVIFNLDSGKKLYFNDLRKFGWIKIIKSEKLKVESFISKLGPEPFKDLTLEKFVQIVSSSSRPIKLILMDQAKISGIGNIYANEALWLAGIDPRVPARQLDSKTVKQLYSAILEVLKKGLKWGGASDQAYIQPSGEEGKYQEHFLIYGREGEVCKRCKKTKIKKIKLGGRGTYCCPFCQA